MGSYSIAKAIFAIGIKVNKSDVFPITKTHHALCRGSHLGDMRFLGGGFGNCPEHIDTPYCPQCGKEAYYDVPQLRDGMVEGEKTEHYYRVYWG